MIWKKGALALLAVLLAAPMAWGAPSEALRDQIFEAIARHDDRGAARSLQQLWQSQATPGAVQPGVTAINEALDGHFQTAQSLMAREQQEHPGDPTRHWGSLLMVLMEGNPAECRQVLETALTESQGDSRLKQRYTDVMESMGLAATWTPSDPAQAPPEPSPAPPGTTSTQTLNFQALPVENATPAPQEVQLVQESQREKILRQLAEAQARQDRQAALEAKQRSARAELAKKQQAERARQEAEKKRQQELAQKQAEAARVAAEKKAKAARVAAEKKRQEAARQAVAKQELAAQQAKQQAAARVAAQKQAQVQQAAARKPASFKVTGLSSATAERAAEAKRQQLKAMIARMQADRKTREQAEQARWASAKGVPTPPPVPAGKVLKWQDLRVGVAAEPAPVLIAPAPPAPPSKRQVWHGETRQSVQARLGRPKHSDSASDEYAGLKIHYDARGRVESLSDESAWYQGPGGARPGMTLREVLACLPGADGIFHLHPTDPAATESLYVLSTADGAIVELEKAGDIWLSTLVEGASPGAVTERYEQLKQQGTVRRLAPDYVFALEARRRPLP